MNVSTKFYQKSITYGSLLTSKFNVVFWGFWGLKWPKLCDNIYEESLRLLILRLQSHPADNWLWILPSSSSTSTLTMLTSVEMFVTTPESRPMLEEPAQQPGDLAEDPDQLFLMTSWQTTPSSTWTRTPWTWLRETWRQSLTSSTWMITELSITISAPALVFHHQIHCSPRVQLPLCVLIGQGVFHDNIFDAVTMNTVSGVISMESSPLAQYLSTPGLQACKWLSM